MINQTQTQTKAGHRPASKQVISFACPAIGFASKPRRCQPLSSCLFRQDVPSLSRSPHEMRRRCPCPCSLPSPLCCRLAMAGLDRPELVPWPSGVWCWSPSSVSHPPGSFSAPSPLLFCPRQPPPLFPILFGPNVRLHLISSPSNRNRILKGPDGRRAGSSPCTVYNNSNTYPLHIS